MINTDKIVPVIEAYKRDFSKIWTAGENHKWKAVKHFQDNWDIDAEDFAEMFKKATDKTEALLVSRNSFPKGMIIEFAKVDANATREMFRRLFDESADFAERVNDFKNSAEKIRAQYDDGTWKQSYQTNNSITTYLWLMYPDKYYIYKYKVYKKCAEMFDDSYRPKRKGKIDEVIGGFKMYDEICAYLQNDKDIRQMLENVLTDDCYPDKMLKTMTIDFGFYTATYYKDSVDEWFPALDEYTPGLSVKDWCALLSDQDVFDENSLTVIKSFYEMGGQATCKELSERFGEDSGFYSIVSTKLAQRIHKKTGCPLIKDELSDNSKWWPILYLGRQADNETAGVYIWKLRDELKEAYEMTVQESKKSGEKGSGKIDTLVIWKISHGTSETGIPKRLRSVLEQRQVVVVNQWTLPLASQKTPQGETYMQEIKDGDYFYLCYAGEIVLFGQFVGDEAILNQEMIDECDTYDWYERSYRIIAHSLDRNKYKGKMKQWTSNFNSTCVKVTDNALFEELILKPYFDLTLDELNKAEFSEPYTKENFLKDVFITEKQYDTLTALLNRKKNIILQGAPGVGKTFSARRLAYSIMGEKDKSRIEFIQFHQSYSYEDFIMGYRPNDMGGFDLQDGVFYRFCEKAKEDPDKKPYFFIIDEINRGNLSKIFGELLMLIESDKRKEEYKLKPVYGDEPFYVPDNLYIIGMMNTADRSLAMIDYALRRRFSFYTMTPAFENADRNGFDEYTKDIECELYHKAVKAIKDLNAVIRADKTLGKGFEIGHSYFIPEDKSKVDDDWVRNVVEYEIFPLIEEYWFDDETKIKNAKDDIKKALGEENDD